MSTPVTESEMSVEQALAELQQMFPEESYGSIEATFFDEVGMRFRIGLKDVNRHWNGSSLNDVMSQARQWNEIHARRFFCSCGGALTATEYAAHRAKGHDSGTE